MDRSLQQPPTGSLLEIQSFLRRAFAEGGRSANAEQHYNLGNRMLDQGRAVDAVAAYRAAICLKPYYSRAFSNMGNALHDLGRFEEAAGTYGQAITLQPDFVEAYCNLANVLNDLGRFDEAGTACRIAVCHQPNFAEAFYNLGIAQHQQGQLAEAVAASTIAIHIRPDFAEAYNNRANGLKDLGRPRDALSAYKTAIILNPDCPEAHCNEAYARLLLGDTGAGWRKYEWRFRGGAGDLAPRAFRQPLWDGEDITGRTVLLHAEQGLGDTIQFCRYAAMVKAGGGSVVLEAPASLLRLFSGLDGIDRLIPTGNPLPDFDLHCPLMSLPRLFDTTLETIPAPRPYLSVEKRLQRKWEKKLANGGRMRVGLVWAGNPVNRNDRNRSLPFAELAPLWQIPGINWYSLQTEERRHDLEAAPSGLVTDLSPHLKDFAETAAALSQLDLLVSVDTAAAHLAGATGCPAWVMLPFAPDWRWLLGRDDSPWYPSLSLFRQTERGNWADVVARLAEALIEEAERRVRLDPPRKVA
ncbi:MAG TPA: tetratricopeptide repeat protein [Rhodospirillaceae bacterium]|nr:tetratricopeptide repeat protein [Rhodospirillaceae bacterium]